MTNFECFTTNCGTLDISSTAYPLAISYKINFQIGGKSGNKVAEVTSNIHTLEIA